MFIRRTGRRLALTSAALAVPAIAAAAFAAVAAPAASAPGRATVKLEDIEFKPARVTIRRGGSVSWRFLDARTPHNVRSAGRPRFRGSPTKQKGIHRVKFGRAGHYRYACTLHLNMKGTVVVR